jgi:flagellar biogenesis protein FliO
MVENRIPILLVLLLAAWPGSLLAQTAPPLLPPPALTKESDGERPALIEEEPGGLPPKMLPIPPPLLHGNDKVMPASFEEPLSGGAKELPANPFSTGNKPSATPSSAASSPSAIPLSPPQHKSSNPSSSNGKNDSQELQKKTSGVPSLTTVASSLGIVVGIFLLIAWAMRRTSPQSHARLPGEAFEILGRAPLSGRQQVQLLRCGNKLLLVSVTSAGTETLTEITDPAEVDRMAGLCRQGHPQSSTAAFLQIFEQLAPKRPARAAAQTEYDPYAAPGIDVAESLRWEDRDV